MWPWLESPCGLLVTVEVGKHLSCSDWGRVEHYGIGQPAYFSPSLSLSFSLTFRRRAVLTAQLLLASPMASLLRVVATSCSSPLFSGLACAKSVRTVKTPCVRFFRTHQALSRLASPGNGPGILSWCITHSVVAIGVTWGGWGHQITFFFPSVSPWVCFAGAYP